ncbi:MULTISPECIES: hypothetical protein [Crocosphaera]|uniref:Uncharacterized protein n=1 Tax=Crocosphaera watsonii WH 0003 TaxID=423471 RepID=G5J4A1_CROWT|nr:MULTISPECIES: hypothetical protein [Crocosphaera]EHJ12985.1 hypothetical protein CWATWH0003_2324 [Crocosphaera watsonii WH 0003]MCH2243772.1 hypothetical protein [Crocosphaera sp.]NQZ60901.1 hypothetical protein [Crocosphaera sp.]
MACYKMATMAKVTPVQNRVLLRAEHKPGNIISVYLHEKERFALYISTILSLT